MAIERTFSILKPDATDRNLTGAINAMIEQAGLRIIAQKRVRITREQAETFYGVHRERPFFGELVDFMTSGPVVVQVLEGENAIAKYRDVMGATDPSKAACRERSARSTPSRSARIRCTVRTRPRPPDGDRAVLLPATSWSVKARQGARIRCPDALSSRSIRR